MAGTPATFRFAARFSSAESSSPAVQTGGFDRPLAPFLIRAGSPLLRDAPRSIAGETPAYGHGEAAYKEEFDKWSGLIDAAANDLSLSRDQRAAAVAALRARQQIAAKGARQRAMEEEKQTIKAAVRARRRLTARVDVRPS